MSVMELFVRHVCLVRPLEEAGKMKVTTDMAQIELALTPFCSKLVDLGRPYKMLRALRYSTRLFVSIICFVGFHKTHEIRL